MRHRTRIYIAASALLLSAHAVAGAQSYDPATQSPLSLLTAPRDPLAYFDARKRASALLGEGKAAEAEPLAEQITREYPRDGENWFLLGQVKNSLKKYPEAAAAYERAAKLLWWGGPGYSTASAATMHLMAGNRRAALDLLRRYTQREGRMDRGWIFGDDDFLSLRTDPEFLEIAGRPDATGWARDYGWRRDVDFLRDEVKRLNAEYRTSPLPPEFERRYEELKQKVPQLSDEQIYVGMNRMLAVLRQGHTTVRALANTRVVYKGLPFQPRSCKPQFAFGCAAGLRSHRSFGARRRAQPARHSVLSGSSKRARRPRSAWERAESAA
jgi:tetratricopeptide (TPR) repeat protein